MSFFDYFQIVLLILFYLVFVGRTIHLRLQGTNPFVLGIGKKGAKALLELSFVLGLAVWTVELVLTALHRSAHLVPGTLNRPVFEVTALRGLGAVLITAGFIFFVWALMSFGKSWRVGIDKAKPGDLVTRGAFARSRNPVFVFLDLYFIGAFLIYSTPFFLLFALITILGIHFQILQEETFLVRQYGEAYEEYRAEVRRYL